MVRERGRAKNSSNTDKNDDCGSSGDADKAGVWISRRENEFGRRGGCE